MTANFHTDGPVTERETYFRKISHRKRELQARVYEAVRSAVEGASGDDCIVKTGLLDYTCRPRITELHDMGLITRIGRRDNRRGNAEMVYAPTDRSLTYSEAFDKYAPKENHADTREQGEGLGQAASQEIER